MVVSYIPPTPRYSENGSYTKTKSNLAQPSKTNNNGLPMQWDARNKKKVTVEFTIIDRLY
jgi:hypothetical protein